nr:unnamed protein product [Haemonchus contortus]
MSLWPSRIGMGDCHVEKLWETVLLRSDRTFKGPKSGLADVHNGKRPCYDDLVEAAPFTMEHPDAEE